jgi:hypothetical protein
VPIEIAYYFGRKKMFGLYGGLKGSATINRASVWENSTITDQYVPLMESDTAIQKVKPNFGPVDVAIDIGFIETLSNYFVLEERVYKGLINLYDPGDSMTVKQTTIEIVLGWKLNSRPKSK